MVLTITPPAPASMHFFMLCAFKVGSAEAATNGFFIFTPQKSMDRSAIVNSPYLFLFVTELDVSKPKGSRRNEFANFQSIGTCSARHENAEISGICPKPQDIQESQDTRSLYAPKRSRVLLTSDKSNSLCKITSSSPPLANITPQGLIIML